MKILFFLSALLLLTASTCNNKRTMPAGNCYKGKLEVKAACMNYTIRLLEGNIDTSLIAAGWTDESTGKHYKNVFALASRCNFPATIQEGDEFYFSIDSTTVQHCTVCMAYYPVPPKRLFIKVFDRPCNQ
jgi:hypothetical protein